MKKLINGSRSAVEEMLEGLADLAPGQMLLEGEGVIARADLPAPAKRMVAVLSGGGAGHEPAHAGYVGKGMLHAAVSGDVFTSPSTDAVLAAIRAVAGPAGVLLVVKNYTGDRLNFGLAAELARAEGIPAEIVVVADDVALHETVERSRRRGIAGTVLVHKIAGAAAAAGMSLPEVAALAQKAADSIGTMGIALGACTVPAAGKPGFLLPEDEAELGLGIHGEPGVRRVKMQPVDGFVDTILATILKDRGLGSGDRVALLVNGLGGTPQMELAIAARAALAQLRQRGLVVERAWCGNFLTAIEMPGLSLSLLPVDDKILSLLDAATEAPAWSGQGRIGPARRSVRAAKPDLAAVAPAAKPFRTEKVRAALTAAAQAFEEEEARLTELDSRAGDGDLGISFVRGAAAVRGLPDGAWASPSAALGATANALRKAIAGSSGPFYATALLRAARCLAVERPDAKTWAEAFAAGVAAVSELGGAKPGDRTMLDALHPAAEAFTAAVKAGRPAGEAFTAALDAAEKGAAATADMLPRLGRASYLGERAKGIPDAGAAAVVVWMRAVARIVC